MNLPVPWNFCRRTGFLAFGDFAKVALFGRPVEPPERNDRLHENGQEGCVTDYLVIGFPHQSGSWAAVFPDFVGVTGRGSDLAQAIDRATEGAISVIRTLTKIGAPLPPPKDLRKVQLEHLWANEYGINWSCAVVSTVALHPQLVGELAPVRPTQRRQIQPFAAPGGAESHVRMSVPRQAGIVVGVVPNPGVQHTEAYI